MRSGKQDGENVFGFRKTGAHSDSFLPNALKTLFRLSKVLLGL